MTVKIPPAVQSKVFQSPSKTGARDVALSLSHALFLSLYLSFLSSFQSTLILSLDQGINFQNPLKIFLFPICLRKCCFVACALSLQSQGWGNSTEQRLLIELPQRKNKRRGWTLDHRHFERFMKKHTKLCVHLCNEMNVKGSQTLFAQRSLQDLAEE